MKHLKTLENIKSISATSCSCSCVKSMVNGGDLCLLNNVFLVSTSVALVLISLALTEFCAEFDYFHCISQCCV